MNPRVEVTITDHYGSYSDLRDEYGEPIEIYINDERVYTEGQVTQLKDENEKLRGERDHWHVEQVHAYGNWEDVYKYAASLKDENAKLRELADAVKEFVEDTHCEDCPHRRDCYDNNRIFCANTFSHNAFAAMRKLGIGVE